MSLFDLPKNQGKPTTNLVLDVKEKALQTVRSRGPLLPVQITKELGVNVLFAGALLSELVDNGVLKISNTKIGGSPVYYVAGQEGKLQALRDKLNDKQQKAFDMLKSSKILRDSSQEPVIRASLRDIKDFAIPLRVTAGPIQEIFWKWYLCADVEVEPIIKDQMGLIEKQKGISSQTDVQKQLTEIEKELKRLEGEKSKLTEKPIEQEVKEELKKEETIQEKPRKIRKKEVSQQAAPAQIQDTLQLQNANKIDETDQFMNRVIDYFTKNNIVYSGVKQIKKDKDFESIVVIPTAVGNVNYFCKAKNKQKINDADLSLLYAQSQMKKLPILLITTGEPTKKAQELINKEFKNITIKRI